MARANFGLAAATIGAVTAFGVNPANADIWIHQNPNNNSFSTSELITGNNITGIRTNISGGDFVYAFTALATSNTINISAPSFNQPSAIFVLDKNGMPFSIGSGYQDVALDSTNFTVPVTAGEQVTLVFGNWGMTLQNGANPLYDEFSFGQINPITVAAWNLTGGQNLSGAEVREYNVTNITGVPTPGVVTSLALAGLVATRRRR